MSSPLPIAVVFLLMLLLPCAIAYFGDSEPKEAATEVPKPKKSARLDDREDLGAGDPRRGRAHTVAKAWAATLAAQADALPVETPARPAEAGGRVSERATAPVARTNADSVGICALREVVAQAEADAARAATAALVAAAKAAAARAEVAAALAANAERAAAKAMQESQVEAARAVDFPPARRSRQAA